jgi:hypothetical protein
LPGEDGVAHVKGKTKTETTRILDTTSEAFDRFWISCRFAFDLVITIIFTVIERLRRILGKRVSRDCRYRGSKKLRGKVCCALCDDYDEPLVDAARRASLSR